MTDDLKARLRCDVNERDNLGRRKNWTEQRSERREAAGRIEALEAALNLAANRLARCALDHGIGTQEFLEVSEWGEEARAALAGGVDE